MVDTSSLVWHYTDAQALVSMVTTRCAWASHVEALNDTSELRFGWGVLSEAWPEARRSLGHVSSEITAVIDDVLSDVSRAAADSHGEVYIISASAHGDNLNQWQHYGAHGYAIGFHRRQMLFTSAQSFLGATSIDTGVWREVLYTPRRAQPHARKALQSAARAVEKQLASPEAAQETGDLHELDLRFRVQHQLAQSVALYKNPAFSAEREYRMVFLDSLGHTYSPVHSRARGGRLVQYIEARGIASDIDDPAGPRLPIHQIRCGPAPTYRHGLNEAAVRRLLRSARYTVNYPGLEFPGFGTVEVDSSTIPYEA